MCLVVKNKPLKAAEAALQLFPAKAEFNSELKALTPQRKQNWASLPASFYIIVTPPTLDPVMEEIIGHRLVPPLQLLQKTRR